MIELAVLLTILIPVALALLWPNGLALAALLTGVLPLTLGPEGMMVTVFGRMDLYAVRLLGLCIASLLVILPHSLEAGKYALQFRWHLIFLVFAMLSLVWAPSMVYGARMIVKLSAPFIFLLLVLVACSSWRDLRRLQYAMVVSGLLATAVAVFAVWGGYSSFSTQLGLGVPGLGPAATSANLAVLSILALALVRTSPGWLAFASLGLFAAGSVAGFTRITLAGLMVGVTVVLWMSIKGLFRWFIPLAGIATVPALFLFSDIFRQRMFKNGGDISLDLLLKNPASELDNIHGSGRFEAWSFVLTSFFKPSPVFGSGVGTTQNYFYTHATGLNVIHSEYIRLLAEVGIVGVVLMGIAVASYMIRLAGAYRASSTREGQAYSLAALGGLTVYVIFMATDNAIDYVTSCGIFVFGLIAMSEKARELEEQESLARARGMQTSDSPALPVEGVGFDLMPSRRFPLVSWR
jgi:O-antigen ligase